MRAAIAILTLSACLVHGCNAPPHRGGSAMSRWADARGGLLGGRIADRLYHACSPLLNTVEGTPILLRVLDDDAVAAYAWPGGGIYLTRGLIDRATDQELAAAVAHELGHLLDDGYLSSPFALDGADREDAETRADLLGCRLLERCGIPPMAMPSLLARVQAAPSTSASHRAALGERIRFLRRTLSQRISHRKSRMPR